MLRLAHDSEADGDRHGVLGDLFSKLTAQPLGDGERVMRLGVGQYQRELLAAHPRESVDRALACVQQASRPLQGRVPDALAGAVVDFPEVVQVADDESHIAAAATRPLELEARDYRKRTPVR